MQVMRQLCADAYFLHFLFVTYDAKEVCSMPEQALTTQPRFCFGVTFLLQHLYSHLLCLHGRSVIAFGILVAVHLASLPEEMHEQATAFCSAGISINGIVHIHFDLGKCLLGSSGEQQRREEEDLHLQPTSYAVQMCHGCQYPGQHHQYQAIVC